ncbi:hypothetical protein BT96DRAFT_682374 [Gymnopus androsaceus JB14]|uniref:Anti-proliferative protein domain-containing protein n=1 Tax=Gymnopus androsaceus JB14 TaxID=1447944 RepID=A0A6A4HPJ8_9AGAR|nr:hypothetical protein BT96DRAFT_682374 [Gymnopus androsaceus JB14]
MLASMNSASTSLYQLVAYLTRPLVAVYPAQTVLQLQISLHGNLASQFLTETSLSPFTLLLSSASLPPTPIYAACLQSGVSWPQWIHALGGQTLYLCVMPNRLSVRVGEVGDAVTIWSEEPIEVPAISRMKIQTQSQSENDESPIALKLKAMLDSARARSSSAEQSAKSIVPPTLLATTCLSRQFSDDADDISDSESDTESTTSSSLFSDMSSTESMSSVSSTSSPISKSADLPLIVEKPNNLIAWRAPVSIPQHPTQHLSRSQRRLAHAMVDKSKADVCQYKYQGGQTSVMTGGVMLGAVKPVATATKSRNSPASAASTTGSQRQAFPRAATKPRVAKVMLVLDSSNNWRTRI